MSIGDGGHDGEPQARTTLSPDPAWIGAPETFEYMASRVRPDPGTVIDDHDPRPGWHRSVRSFEASDNLERTALRCVGEGIGYEVPEQLT
jgi:hypothetical protein